MKATGVTHTETDEVEQNDPKTLAKDDLFHLLQNERRRRAVKFLLDREGSVDMGSVAEHIAALENDITVAELSSAQRKRVYVGLYQCHLPKLDEASVVDYDKNRGTVSRTHLTESLAPYLTVDEESSDDDDEETSFDAMQYPVAATALATVLTVAAWASVLPTAGLWLPTVLTLAFAAATVASVVR